MAQGWERINIAKGSTRLTKLICHYVDTDSLTQDGEILPTPVSMDNSEDLRRTSQPPSGPVSRANVVSPCHTLSPGLPELIPFHHILHNQQPHCTAAETCMNTAKRRRVSEDEGEQPPTVCSTPIQQEKHNMNDRLTMLPGEQVSDAGAASATISSVDADDHDSHAPQPSGQDGLEHSYSSTIPSPTSQGVMNSSATVSVGGREDGLERSSTRAKSARPTSSWQDTRLGANGISDYQSTIVAWLTRHRYPAVFL